MARAYAYDRSSAALYHPAVGATFFEDWSAGDTARHDLLCAEMSRLAYAGRQDAGLALQRVGFTLEHWMGGETLEERRKTVGTDGFVAAGQGGGPTVLSFRGTEANKPEDVLADGLATAEPWDVAGAGGARVHVGFARAYRTVREGIGPVLDRQNGPLLITGHSLGAALATLAAAEHAARRPELITFGSPRVGDHAFARRLDGLTVRRFVGCCDLVTRIPPERFDQPHVDALLTELMPEKLRGFLADNLISVVAFALAKALAVVRIQPEYVHVGPAQYRDRTGQPLADETAIASDQRSARAEYPGGLLPEPKALLQQLLLAVTTAAGADNLRAAIRTFGAKLFAGGTVPLRDLADHAPINYVSLFSGRG